MLNLPVVRIIVFLYVSLFCGKEFFMTLASPMLSLLICLCSRQVLYKLSVSLFWKTAELLHASLFKHMFFCCLIFVCILPELQTEIAL